MNECKKLFAQTSYDNALRALSLPDNAEKILPSELQRVALFGAAQAALESNWGTSKGFVLHNNPLGIKPIGNQPGAGPVRIFETISGAWESWAYLVCQSSHYDWPRRLINGSKNRAYFNLWAFSFAKKYCPVDNMYFKKIEVIMKQIKNANVDKIK
jgi:uncharacterized FlgJ-related protein